MKNPPQNSQINSDALDNKSEVAASTTKTSMIKSRRSRKRRFVVFAIDTVLIVFVLCASLFGYTYATSPDIIRNPKLEHYHFRMQIIVNGAKEDFGIEGYQTGYAKDQCNAALPEQPIHFHDNKDQFTHIHWEGVTGGMVLKYYGWNFIGGRGDALGYKLNDLTDIQKVNTHGNYLPSLPQEANFYIYTGDETSYKERTFDEWKDLDLEDFFGVTSNFPAHEINKATSSNNMIQLVPKASAQTDVSSNESQNPIEETELEELTRINNLIGNVVIFVQKDKPTESQILERFQDLEPLSDSTCGG